MKQFLRQLRLLLWKNFTLRRRQIFRNVIEVVWPLAIFIILVSVRHKKPPENVPIEKRPIYYAPRALPSAGGLMFVQSLFCNYRVSNFQKDPQELPSFSTTRLFKLVEDFAPIINNQTQMKNIEQLSKDIRVIMDDSIKIANNIRGKEIAMKDILGDDGFTLLTVNANLNESTAVAILNATLKIDHVFDMFSMNNNWNISDLRKINISNLNNMTAVAYKVKDMFCNGSYLADVMTFPANVSGDGVRDDLCSKLTVFSMEMILSDIYGRSGEIEKKIPAIGEITNLTQVIMEKATDVNKEFELIPNLNKIMSDVRNLLNSTTNMQNGMLTNLTNREFIESFICGRNITRPNITDTSTQPTPTPATTTTTTMPPPITGGGSDPKCNLIPPVNRTDCGWGRITPEQCLKLNCCSDTSIPHTKYCFCPTTNTSSCCHKRRKFVMLLSQASGYTAQMVDFFTMVLEGKIYYTPDNSKTRMIMGKITGFIKTFVNSIDQLKVVRPIIDTFMNTTETLLKDRNILDDAKIFKEVFKNITILDSLIKTPLIGPEIEKYKSQIETAQQFLSNFTNEYGDYLNSSYLTEERIASFRKMSDSFVSSLDDFQGIVECYNLTNLIQAVSTEEELVRVAVLDKQRVNFLSSVVFMNLEDSKPFPEKVEYKLRYNPDYVPSTSRIKTRYWKAGPGPWGSNGFWRYQYINFGFVFFQDMIDRSLMEVLTNRSIQEPGVYIQQFPYPCYIRDRFVAWLGNFMPLFMTLAWIYTVAMIVKSVVYEKELRLKEVMKVMGLTNTVHWCAWFITSFVMMFITICCLVALLKYGGIIIYSDVTVILFVMSIFACSSIALAFLISVFFARANISAACGGIIYFFTYLPYPLTLWFEEQMTFSSKGFVSLFSTTAFGLSFKYISRWEEQGIGAQWSNYYDNPMPTDSFSLGVSVNFLLLDTFLYLFVMWYLEHVLPGQYGIPKPWYFMFTKTYWTGKSINRRKIHTETEMYQNLQEEDLSVRDLSIGEDELQDTPRQGVRRTDYDSRKFEAEPTNSTVGVYIKNLIKIYSNKKKAVDNLTMKMYEGQITALLGHNGAGKSTTMSILTGLFPPTSGTAYVYGKDIQHEVASVRKSLGLCPQHNVLFDDMTVDEHMWFYGKLKGLDDKQLKTEIEKFLADVGLVKKRKEYSKNLSGGMKRKLSVAMAFIADSKTVILDEPTSGVDPYSRRGIWDLILKYKKDRTILLSTHYMDEADLLGDRISIISEGVLQCTGSPLFLKRHFGKGYFLTITKDMDDITDGFKVEEISKFVCSFIPGAKLHYNLGSEISFVMPSAARLTGEFSLLFNNLEENIKQFGIKSYGISDTTLEEVFLKACNSDNVSLDNNTDNLSLTGPLQSRRSVLDDNISLASFSSQNGLLPSNDGSFENLDVICDNRLLWGPLLWLWQFKALLIKRFHHARRAKKGFFSQILLPAIFVICAMGVSMIRPPTEALPSLKLSTEMLGKPNYIVIENRDINQFSDNLMKSYLTHSKQKYFVHNNMSKYSSASSKCSCSSGKQTCNAYPSTPASMTMNNGDVVLDITGGNMQDYLLKSTDQFIRRRHGGASFGESLYDLPDDRTSNITRFITNGTMSRLVSAFGVRRNVKVWFNHKTYHALPTYINMMNNAILKANLDNGKHYEIVTYNHPMDFNREQIDEKAMRQGISDLFVAIFVITALAFVPASFVVYLVQDRASKSKHLQLVSGMNPVIYWLANFTWDMINYMIPATCITIIFLAFNQTAYVSADNFPATLVLLLLYGWSMTPLMYPSSFIFDIPSTAYIVLICANLFIGIIGTIATFILDFFGDDDIELRDINHVLKIVLLIFPNYAFGRGLMDLAGNQLQADIYERFGSTKFANPFQWDIIGRNVFAMTLMGIIYFTLTVLIQYGFFIKPWSSKINSILQKREEDVDKEQKRVKEDKDTNFILKTDSLSKLYKGLLSKRKTLAVDRLSFGIEKGECFGLLGVNGAGKTSTFKMLTGDTPITCGDAFIKGISVRENMNQARQFMGYCPQFDALDDLLTGKELLTYYAQIRGMTHADGEKMANWAIETLGLSPYKDRTCGNYSGGNKRKLSTAIALLGSPPLIFLDEPTTGMDPGARRFLWNVVTCLIKNGKSVVLTSHSMEECETLCTRLAIMVNGEFQCIGSPQHLRSKFGMGYTLIIRAKSNNVNIVQDYIEANFKDVKLKDRHHYMLEYQVPKANLLLSTVFVKLEFLRKTGSIEDYSVTQTTLDQIFVNFARNQTESVEYEDTESADGNNVTNIQLADAGSDLQLESWPPAGAISV